LSLRACASPRPQRSTQAKISPARTPCQHQGTPLSTTRHAQDTRGTVFAAPRTLPKKFENLRAVKFVLCRVA
jgi:hypothetical protein